MSYATARAGRGNTELNKLLTEDRIGQSVPARVLRSGQLTDVQVVIGQRP